MLYLKVSCVENYQIHKWNTLVKNFRGICISFRMKY